MTALGFSPAGITQELQVGVWHQQPAQLLPQPPAWGAACFPKGIFFSFLVDLGNYTKSPEPPGSQMGQVKPNLAQEEQGWQPPAACGRAPCAQGHPVTADPLSAPTFPPDRQTAGLAQSPKKLSLIPIHIFLTWVSQGQPGNRIYSMAPSSQMAAQDLAPEHEPGGGRRLLQLARLQ